MAGVAVLVAGQRLRRRTVQRRSQPPSSPWLPLHHRLMFQRYTETWVWTRDVCVLSSKIHIKILVVCFLNPAPVMLSWWCLILTQGLLAGSGVSAFWQDNENLFREKYSKCYQMQKEDWWRWLKLGKIVQILQSTSCVGKGAVTPLSAGSQSSHAQDVVSIQFPIGFIFDIVSRVLQCSTPICSLLRGDWMAPILFCGGEYKSWSGGAEINSFHRPLHPVKQKPLNSKWKKIHREWIWLW